MASIQNTTIFDDKQQGFCFGILLKIFLIILKVQATLLEIVVEGKFAFPDWQLINESLCCEELENVGSKVIQFRKFICFLWKEGYGETERLFGDLPIVTIIRPIIPAVFDLGKYAILYKIGRLIAGVFMATISTAFDAFFISLMALCGAQLDILEERLMNIWDDANETFDNPLLKTRSATVRDVVQHILKECVILQETINRFVDKLSTLPALPFGFQYGISCFMIYNTILQLTILSSPDLANIIGLCSYSGVVFAQVAVYHLLGNEILYKSNKIIEAAYLSEWYKLDIKSQKCLVLLMERAKRPLVISVYKVIFISLESLMQIIQWSYSIFALIKASYN